MSPHPYPAHLVSQWSAPDGTRICIRPIRPGDADLERDFVKGLSSESRYLRFMGAIRELTPEMLARFTQIDYDREMALIAIAREHGREVQVAVARYVVDADDISCEFAIVVTERWQGRGLGHHLMTLLIELARARGLRTMTGRILARNNRMLDLAGTLGFIRNAVATDFAIREVTLTL